MVDFTAHLPETELSRLLAKGLEGDLVKYVTAELTKVLEAQVKITVDRIKEEIKTQVTEVVRNYSKAVVGINRDYASGETNIHVVFKE